MLRLDNYFSKAMIRVLIDHNLNDLGNVLTSDHMDRMAERVKKNIAQSIIKHTRSQITELIEHANGIAEVEMTEIVKQASETMKNKQAAELERLVSLSKVNPNIRKEEIKYLETITTQAEEFLQHSQLKLDAIRVAVSRR
jgi:ATP-dependent helicase HepA